MGSNVGNEEGADAFPRGPCAVDEVILDDPVLVRLAHHRPLVVDASLFLEVADVLRRRRRRDAVNHGARVLDLIFEPLAERFVNLGSVARGVDDAFLGDVAVVREVVAGHDGEGPAAEAVTHRERREDEAEDGSLGAARVEGLGHGEGWVLEDALVGELE